MKRLSVLAMVLMITGSLMACGNKAQLPDETAQKDDLETPQETGTEELRQRSSSICVYGPVKEISEDSILIDNQSGVSSAGEMFLLVSSDTTKIVDAKEGIPVNLSDIAVDEIVYAYIGDAMTMSLPPQTSAELVLVVRGDLQKSDIPVYVEVESIEAQAEGERKVISADGGEYFLRENTSILPFKTKNIVTADDVQKGSKCLLWSDDSQNVTKLVLIG